MRAPNRPSRRAARDLSIPRYVRTISVSLAPPVMLRAASRHPTRELQTQLVSELHELARLFDRRMSGRNLKQ
jgi:hypothetical protein